MSETEFASNRRSEFLPQEPIVLSIAFPYAPIGEAAAGGAEVVLSNLEAALFGFGFASVVVAHAAFRPHGRLYPVAVPSGEITEAVQAAVESATQASINLAVTENVVSLVHMHGLDFARYRLPPHLPVLVTLHLPPDWYPQSIWDLPRNYHLICVSETQRRACPAAAQHRLTVVGNGVAPPAVSALRSEGSYALMLSRICPEKNLHVGLDAARLAGLPVLLAGEVSAYREHQRYFTEQIEPRLTRVGLGHQQHGEAAGARFLGPQTGAAKSRLLTRAACLLLPSLAPETSSMVAMEALAAGVPVIAMASGAVPEIVEDSATGFLLDPALGSGQGAADAMAEAIHRLSQIDRRHCRAVAEERFGLEPMLGKYAVLYQKLALPGALAETARPTKIEHGSSHPGVKAIPEPIAMLAACLTETPALTALVREWRHLWHADEYATPFQHPAWLMPWWAQFGPEGSLSAITLREPDGTLCALLPTYVYPDTATGERKLLWIGAGTTDYLDGLFIRDREVKASRDAALSALMRHSLPHDVLVLTQVSDRSPLLAAATSRSEGELQIAAGEPCSVIDLTRDLRAKVRANTGRYRRRAEATAPLECSLARSVPQALASFEELRELHGRRWEERGEPGVLADPRVVQHHRQAIPSLLEAGLLRLFRLRWNGELLGVLYALADPPQRPRRSLYLYLIGFDSRFADLSPGTLLLHAVHTHARENGFSRLDLLRGGEAYKRLWGAQTQKTSTILANRREATHSPNAASGWGQ